MSVHRLFAVLVLVLSAVPAPGAALTLAEAERLALERAPWYAHHRTNVEAAAERVIYEGRLPDPQLTLGALNVPTDRFSLRENEMTMLVMGVRQSFPPGETLRLKSERARQELAREEAMLELERRNLLKQVRQTWLELYYLREALAVLDETRTLQKQLLQAAEGRYRARIGTPQEVFRARQALGRLDERAQDIRTQTVRAQAQLSRWIGEEAFSALPARLPPLPPPADFEPERHPEMLAARAGLEALRAEVAMAREEYKPGVMVELSYGFRRRAPDGMNRPDMLTAMVTLDVPVFRAKRQDRRLAERQARTQGAHHELEDKRRELLAMYRAVAAEHASLTERVRIFEERVLPEARREAEVTIAGFAREQAERREARMKALEAALELTRLRVELARAQTELLYLAGEQ